MPSAEEPVTKPARRRSWRVFFTVFKWCRISILLFLLVVIVLGLFLDHVGLPGWLEQRVEEQLRAKGWEMKFSRLRLRWYRGIVAEDLQLQRADTTEGPHLFVRTAEFRLNWEAFKAFDLEASSAMLKGGRLLWPLPGTNQPKRTFVLDDIGGELFFRRGDQWELKFLETRTLGVHVRFRGDITNASLVRDWKLPVLPGPSGAAPGTFWHHFLNEAEKIHFAGRPELQVIFSGDARDWDSLGANLRFTGLGLDSAWGSGTNISLGAQLRAAPRSNDAVRVELRLTAEDLHGPWGVATNLGLSLGFEPSFSQLLATNLFALLELRAVQTRWGHADRLFLEVRSRITETNVDFNQTRLELTGEGFHDQQLQVGQAFVTATAVHARTDFLPTTLETEWTLRDLRTSWITSRWAQAVAKLDLPSRDDWRATSPMSPGPEPWRVIPLQATLTLSDLLAPALETREATIKARWRFPNLELDARTVLNDSPADLTATFQAEARELRARARHTLDPRKLVPFFGTNTQAWLGFWTFASLPQLQAEARLILPSWTNHQSDWAGLLFPSLELSGQLEAGAGACRAVPFTSVHLPFTLTNLSWTIPALRIARPEGALQIAGSSDQRTGDFLASVSSNFDLMSLRPAFPAGEAQKVFDFFRFTTPPEIEGQLRGNWRDPGRFNGQVFVAVTNVAFRGQAIKACTARVAYTNRFLSILEPVVLREGEQGTAAGIGIDLAQRRLFLTNAVGRLAPRAIAGCIGSEADRAIAPFVFDLAPSARAEGSVPLAEGDHSEEMRFEVEGGPFHWERFHLEQVRATLLWRGDTLTITNFQGRWHGADVLCWGHFDFSPKDTDIFSFYLRVNRGDLRAVLRDVQPGKVTRVEGTVSGELHVTRAETRNWKSWQGYGHLQLTNGLLWDIPLFGVFSPVLNTILPGLGNSRARHATATYNITNSVIYSKDLEIHATAMRMRYQGWVDFDRHVDGRMEAELLRDLPAVGFLLSKVLWPVTKLFEYKITGTLDNPKTEELYMISRILLTPLHPLKSFKEILGVEEKPPE